MSDIYRFHSCYKAPNLKIHPDFTERFAAFFSSFESILTYSALFIKAEQVTHWSAPVYFQP